MGLEVDKSGRSDTCMQLIADPRYMKTDDKQKAVIRSPISVGMTWESETTNVITSLCAVLVQDMINLSTFKWTHPDGFTVTFTNKYFVADNKATSMAIGNQTGVIIDASIARSTLTK